VIEALVPVLLAAVVLALMGRLAVGLVRDL